MVRDPETGPFRVGHHDRPKYSFLRTQIVFCYLDWCSEVCRFDSRYAWYGTRISLLHPLTMRKTGEGSIFFYISMKFTF